MPTAKWLDLKYDIYDRYSAAQDQINLLTLALDALIAECQHQGWDSENFHLRVAQSALAGEVDATLDKREKTT